jgi:hypothetical protein
MMPNLTGRAALYIAHRLAHYHLLVDTDRYGYVLALQLARVATPGVKLEVRELLRPMVRASVAVGQQPPAGWEE